MSKENQRLQIRSELVDKIIEYKKLCEECDYQFDEDFSEVLFDATDGEYIAYLDQHIDSDVDDEDDEE